MPYHRRRNRKDADTALMCAAAILYLYTDTCKL